MPLSQVAVKGCGLGFSPDRWNSHPRQSPGLSLLAQTVPAAKAHTFLLDWLPAGRGGGGQAEAARGGVLTLTWTGLYHHARRTRGLGSSLAPSPPPECWVS